MSILGTIFLAIIGMATIAGLSLALYSILPANILNLASQHGRYSGLGVSDNADDANGNAPVITIGSFQGQSV